MSKLNKIYELRVQVDGEGNNAGDNVIIRSPITIEFHIERNNQATQNNANIKVFNLSPETRTKIFHDRLHPYDINKPIGTNKIGIKKNGEPVYSKNYPRTVLFFAGYEGQGAMSLIFAGQLLSAQSTRRGSDFITEIDCIDPGVAKYTQSSARTLEKTTDMQDVIRILYTDLVGKETAATGYISPSFKGVSARGYVLQGNSMKLLRELTGGHTYFDLGKPITILFDETIPGTTIYELNSNTGLLNIPQTDGVVVTVNMVFSPELQINQAVVLTSEEKSCNGTYTIGGIRHSGIISGTHDGPTTTELNLMGKGTGIW